MSPGVAAVGSTREECEHEMREAIEFHLEGLAEDGEPVPQPHSALRKACWKEDSGSSSPGEADALRAIRRRR